MKKIICIFVTILIICCQLNVFAVSNVSNGESISLVIPSKNQSIIELAKAYTAQTGVKVKIINDKDSTLKSYVNRVNALLHSENPPDLVYSGGIPIDSFVTNAFLNLDGKIDISELYKDVIAECYHDKELLTVPISLSKKVLVANVDILDNCGLLLPDSMTLSDFTSLCSKVDKLTEEAVYGGVDFKQGSSWTPDEFSWEAFTFSNLNDGTTDYGNEQFVKMLGAYIDFYKMQRNIKLSGSFNENKNIEYLKQGKLVFSICNLGTAYAAVKNDDSLKICDMPCGYGENSNAFAVVDSISIINEGNTKAALDFLHFLLGKDAQDIIAKRGYIPISRITSERLFTDTAIIKMLDRMSRRSFVEPKKLWELVPAYGNYAGVFLFSDEALSINQLTDYSYNMKADVETWFSDIKIVDKKSPIYTIIIFVLWSLICLAILANLVMIVSAFRTVIQRMKSLGEINRGKYGRILDTVQSRKAEAVIVALAGVIFSGLMIGIQLRIGEVKSIIPLHMRQLMLTILALIGLGVSVIALITALLAKIIFCEKAVVVITGFNLRVIYADSIEKIISNASSPCTIITHTGKPVVLRMSEYYRLREGMERYKKIIFQRKDHLNQQ